MADWAWTHTSDGEGRFSYDQIQCAALITIAQRLRQILARLDSLGADGIHAVIREAAAAVPELREKRMDRARKRRKPRALHKAA